MSTFKVKVTLRTHTARSILEVNEISRRRISAT